MTPLSSLPTSFPDAATFAKAVSRAIQQEEKALGHRAWFTWSGKVADLTVELKTYSRSYPQRLLCHYMDQDGWPHNHNAGGAMDLNVSGFVTTLSSIKSDLPA